MPGEKDWCAVVMPCLNEQENLLAACRSLGFAPAQKTPERCFLVLVDNGSTDETLDTCRMLRSVVGEAVIVAEEPIRGHVPARHCGNLFAAQHALSRGTAPADVIVIQADADTQYSPGYVDSVREAIWASSAGAPIGQAVTLFPPDFKAAYPQVFSVLDSVDRTIEQRFGFSRFDVVVDDKACAYRLGDYEQWGGHRREYFEDGSEILAETTRLTISGLAHGAERIAIAGAFVVHSQRRLLGDAAQELGAAGFPYVSRRLFPNTAPVSLDALEEGVAGGEPRLLASVANFRAAHLVALMAVLPAHLARILTGEPPADPEIRRMLEGMPRRSVNEAMAFPGRLLGDVLQFALAASA